VTKIVKVATATLFALALACGTLLAQNRVSDFFTVTPSTHITPFTDFNNATVTLYTNLGPTPTNEYYNANGYCVTGNNQSGCGTTEQWIATPFYGDESLSCDPASGRDSVLQRNERAPGIVVQRRGRRSGNLAQNSGSVQCAGSRDVLHAG